MLYKFHFVHFSLLLKTCSLCKCQTLGAATLWGDLVLVLSLMKFQSLSTLAIKLLHTLLKLVKPELPGILSSQKQNEFIFFSFGLNHPLLTAYLINFTELALFGFLLRALLCYDVMSWYILSYCCWGHRVSKDSCQWNIGCRTKIHPWNCCGMYLCSFFY